MNTQDVIKLASHHLDALSGHTIEFNTVEFLNKQEEFASFGIWQRQDPGFPDTIFVGKVQPIPGLEIKAWFPLATEITARFKDSQNHFQFDQTHVAMLAWLPENIIYGRPRILIELGIQKSRNLKSEFTILKFLG